MTHLIQLSLDGFGAPATTRCAICGRTLTDPESVQRGVGPVCAGKHGAGSSGASTDSETTNIRHLSEPITAGFLFRLLPNSDLETNVPHIAAHHSPSGFSIGYGGSGCADIALNTLEATLRALDFKGERVPVWDGNTVFALAWNLHQDFKWQFIAPMVRTDELQRIPFADVVAFITQHQQEHEDAE